MYYLGGDSTPAFTNNYQDEVTKDGSRFTGATFSKLIFTANFLLRSTDYYDQKLLRHEIYQLFGDRELVRFRTDIDLEKVMYGRPTSFDIKFVNDGSDDSLFSIQFEIPSGYKYSIARSDEMTLETTSFGMNHMLNERPFYRWTTNEFKIYNPSDVAIDPYYQQHDFNIIISFSGESISIVNNTNGTNYQYNKSIGSDQELILHGLVTMIDGKSDSLNSNFGYIKLEKGWNDITVSGATSHKTTFSFPFVYID